MVEGSLLSALFATAAGDGAVLSSKIAELIMEKLMAKREREANEHHYRKSL